MFSSLKNIAMHVKRSTVYPSSCLCYSFLIKLLTVQIETQQYKLSPASHNLQNDKEIFGGLNLQPSVHPGLLIERFIAQNQFHFQYCVFVQYWNFTHFPNYIFCKREGENFSFLDFWPESAHVFKWTLPCLARKTWFLLWKEFPMKYEHSWFCWV